MKIKQSARYYLAAGISLLTFAVYLPALKNDFVEWDDGLYIFENSHIRSFDPDFLKWAFLDFSASNWHPLTWISHALDYAVWGLNPMGHHLTNIILHAVNTAVVVFLIVQLLQIFREKTNQDKPSLFQGERAVLIAAGVTGLLFGIHPLHVESVAWVSERKDLLYALFYLLSIVMYAKYAGSRQSGGTEKDGSGQKHFLFDQRYLISLGFFILSLLSKPMAVTLPAVLLILDWHPFNRIRSLKTLLPALIEKLPFIALSLVSAILTILAQKAGGALATIDAIPLTVRMCVAAKSLFDYLFRTILPMNLIPFYPYPYAGAVSFFQPMYLVSVVLLAGITITCIALMKTNKVWLAVWAYYVVSLTPVLGLVQVGSQATADRYMYLPGIGPFFILGLAAARLLERGDSLNKGRVAFRIFVGVVAVTSIIALASLTVQQIRIWRNTIVLWTDTIQKSPDVTNAYLNRALAYKRQGAFAQAIEDYQKAISLSPTGFIAHYNLGNIYLNEGRIDEAIEQYRLTIAVRPDYIEARNNLGVAFNDKGWTDQAIEQHQIAVTLKPDYAEGHYNLGQAYLKKGFINEAIEQFQVAVSLEPGNRSFQEDLEAASEIKKPVHR